MHGRTDPDGTEVANLGATMTRLLIVEDDTVLRKHLARLFAREGYTVTTAASRAEALQKIAGARFEAMLLDVMLPDGDGLDLLASLTDVNRPARAVVMTAYTTPDNEARAARLDVDHLVRKPLDLHQILGAVRG